MKNSILILGFVSILNVTLKAQSRLPASAERLIVYSEERNALVFKDSTEAPCCHIVIKSLPPLSNNATPVNIVFPKGKYTISKSDDLSIPGDYRVYIEDLDEEKNYNLNLSDSHSFKATNDEYPGRFILHIERPGARLASK